MEGNPAILMNAVRHGHSSAWSEAQKCMPALDINELISIISSVLGAEENQEQAVVNAAKKLAEKYKKPMEVYLNALSVSLIENGLKQVKFGAISQLGTEDFAEKIVSAAKKVETAIAAYCHSEIDEIELINKLSHTGILEVGKGFVEASGINLAEVKEQIQSALGEAREAGILLISFYASAVAYKMLQEAMHDATVMREDRLRIEGECTRSVEMMSRYRKQLHSAVSDYLYIRAETFNTGISAMDQAILNGDTNGFVRGNTMIQEILIYKVQFHDQDEFDALMNSDSAFSL